MIKHLDRDLRRWYYRDPEGGWTSPEFEHEGMADKWVEVHGAYTVFTVVRRSNSTGVEEVVNDGYQSRREAEILESIERRGDLNRAFTFYVREELHLPASGT